MTFDIGYNVDTGSVPKFKMINDMIKSGSNFHLIMSTPPNGIAGSGDLNLLWDVYNALSPTMVNNKELTLMWRWYSNLEGGWKLYPSPTIYQSVLSGMDLPPNTILDSVSNEPELGGNSISVNKEYIEFERKMLKACYDAGVRYAVGAFSVGTPHEQLIATGIYDDLLRDVSTYNGALSVHLYNQFPFEAGETHPFDIMLRTEENKQLIRHLVFNNVKWGDYKEYMGWYAGRMRWWEKRCFDLNIPMPDSYVSEGVTDILTIPTQIMSAWKNSFGIDIYQNDPRGILTWFNHMKWVFPELSINEIIVLLLRHLRDNILYQDYIKGLALFGYNRNWDYPSGSHKESGHNWENAALDGFRESGLIQLNRETTQNNNNSSDNNNNGDNAVVYVPDNEPTHIDRIGALTATTNINLRNNPFISQNTLFNPREYITRETTSIQVIDSTVTVSQNNYEWIHFIRLSDGKEFFVAKVPELTYFLPDENNEGENNEDKKYVVDLLGATQIMSQVDRDNLVDLFENVQDVFNEVHNEGGDVDLLQELKELVDSVDEANVEQFNVFMDILIEALKESLKF